MEYGSGIPHKRVIDYLEKEQTLSYVSFDICDNDNISQNNQDSQDADENENKNENTILAWVTEHLKQSQSAKILLKEALDKGWKITLDDLEGGDYCMNVEERTLTLDNNGLSANALMHSEYFLNTILTTAIKALRDIWQEKRFGGFDENYTPKDVILMERVRAADLDVISILVAWELQEEGNEECWQHINGTQNNDLVQAFSSYLEHKPCAALALRQALLATFKQWFCENARVDRCDHDTLEYLDEVLEMSEYVNPFGTKHPGRMNIEMLSILPGGSAYLQGQGGEVLGEDLFSTLNNDINYAHLNHITHDTQSITIKDVSFRDTDLARKIFPESFKG